jgi:protein SCO1/2
MVREVTVRLASVADGTDDDLVPRPEPTVAKLPLALIAIAVLSGGLIAGLLLGGLGTAERSRAASAPGLRAERLPGDLDRSPAPAFRLRDGRGGVIDTRTLRGRPYAVTFLYTRCRDVCPAIADDLRDALRGTRAAVVAVSVDPQGDTPRAVRAFARTHRLPAEFHYAIGDRAALAPVWSAYFSTPQTGRSGHTAAVWLVDARGRLRAMYPGGIAIDAADIAHDLRALI